MSCAQLTTRPRAARSKHVHSRARRVSRGPSERSSSGPHHGDPPDASMATVSRLASCAPLTTRGGRTYARSSQGPYARGSCHARELVTRAATYPERAVSIPVETEGHREQAERDAARETLRIRSRRARAPTPEPPRVSRDVSGSAQTRPRSTAYDGTQRVQTTKQKTRESNARIKRENQISNANSCPPFERIHPSRPASAGRAPNPRPASRRPSSRPDRRSTTTSEPVDSATSTSPDA